MAKYLCKECFANYGTTSIDWVQNIFNCLCYVETLGPGSEDCGWVDGIPEPNVIGIVI
jgi:hypothetical protein